MTGSLLPNRAFVLSLAASDERLPVSVFCVHEWPEISDPVEEAESSGNVGSNRDRCEGMVPTWGR